LFLGIASLTSCTDDILKIDSANFLAPELQEAKSGASYVLTKDQADETLTTFSWSAADYGAQTGTSYTLQIDFPGNGFADAVSVFTTSDLSYEITVAEMNNRLVAMELPMEVASNIEARIMAYIPNVNIDTLYSEQIDLEVTPYQAKDPLYVVGGYQGWDNSTALEMNRNLAGLQYELYANLVPNEWGIKFLPVLGSWDAQFGDDGNTADNLSGTLTGDNAQNMLNGGGGNNALDGYYLIQADLKNMTWRCTLIQFGLIGSATPDGWDSDQDMTYNPATEQWEITLDLVAGEIKFRANDDWAINFGDSDMDGNLELGGDNIAITAGGNYTVVMKLAPAGEYTYSVMKN